MTVERPNFKDIVIRQITFAPHHMQSMFGAPHLHSRLQRRLSGTGRPVADGVGQPPNVPVSWACAVVARVIASAARNPTNPGGSCSVAGSWYRVKR